MSFVCDSVIIADVFNITYFKPNSKDGVEYIIKPKSR